MTQLVSRRNSVPGRRVNGINTLPQVLNELDSFFNSDWMEDIFRDFDRTYRSMSIANFPPCNISTDKDGTIKFEFALAGYNEDDLNVDIEDDKLVVSASRREEEGNETEEAFIHHGIRAREFRVAYPIGPRFDSTKAKAAYRNGMLTVTIPVAEDKKPRNLKIAVEK